MREQNVNEAMQRLLDRQEILDCVTRYCSAVDRFDRAMLLSVYHPDATDDHGTFVGSREAFADWAFSYHAKFQHGHKHYVLNHLCELDGDVAHTETYWIFAALNVEGPPTSLHGGRYLDRFERRDGRWAISDRKCIIEWGGALQDMPVPEEVMAAYAATGIARRDRMDPAYQRPLTVDREGFVLPF